MKVLSVFVVSVVADTETVSLPSYCPGSPASIHANAQLTTTATASCDVVKQEIKDRLAGKNGWYDQHNRGTYTEVSPQNGATISATRLTGNGKYTDKMNWVLSGSGNTCQIQTCSESQVFSIADSSANYCNTKLPMCGSDEGCKVANADFSTKGESVTKSGGAGAGISNCLVAADLAVSNNIDVSLPSYCPGSPASIHANAQLTATATASCDAVKQEIKDRLAGKNGWYDQHNRGTYTEVSPQNGATISATRLTGNGKYTDKMNWVLSGSGNTCQIQTCSESQVFSIADSSANYCNTKLPMCGTDEGCKVANTDFSTKGESVTKSGGAGAGISNCLVAADVAV